MQNRRLANILLISEYHESAQWKLPLPNIGQKLTTCFLFISLQITEKPLKLIDQAQLKRRNENRKKSQLHIQMKLMAANGNQHLLMFDKNSKRSRPALVMSTITSRCLCIYHLRLQHTIPGYTSSVFISNTLFRTK